MSRWFKIYTERWRWQGPEMIWHFWILWARYCNDRKLFRQLRDWLWPNFKLHTFTLDLWDVKHEKTTVARPIVEHTHADPKGFYLAELLWRTSVALMCLGVTRYQSKLVQILKVKFGWGTHELGKAICFVTFCCVWVVLGGLVRFDYILGEIFW